MINRISTNLLWVNEIIVLDMKTLHLVSIEDGTAKYRKITLQKETGSGR